MAPDASRTKLRPTLIYWGHYVAHDNNRDAMGMTLRLTRNVLNTYVDWKAQVLHDLHESVPYLYDNTIGDGPYNAWIDPLLTNEWQMIGWNNVQEMTRLGMPGVFTHGNFDTWSPGYLMFIAATHNGISRLYETFGNGGSAETLERTLRRAKRRARGTTEPAAAAREMVAAQQQQLRADRAPRLAQLLRRTIGGSSWRISTRRASARCSRRAPRGRRPTCCRPTTGASARRPSSCACCSVSTWSSPGPRLRSRWPPGATGGCGASGCEPAPLRSERRPARHTDSAATSAGATRTFPAGSYLVRMDQPYSRIADALLDYQYWSPDDPQKSPYDDTGWTFPEGFAVDAVRVTDPRCSTCPWSKCAIGASARWRDRHGNASSPSTRTATTRSPRCAITQDADIQVAEEPFSAAGHAFARGSFIVRGVPASELDKAAKQLGLSALALSSAPSVPLHPVVRRRVAILHTWSGTQTEGWWRRRSISCSCPTTTSACRT